MFQKEFDFYLDKPIADDTLDTYQLCWLDEDNGERGPVRGEVGAEWLEMHEVGTYFNADPDHEDYDGLFYYIGDEHCNPLRPPLRELQSSNNFYFDYPHFLPIGYSERLAWGLLEETE